jgi:trehalose-6-phosphate synthase
MDSESRSGSEPELAGEAWSNAVPVIIAANRLPVRLYRCDDRAETSTSTDGASLDSAASGKWRVEWAGDRVIEAQNTFSHHEISSRADIKFVGRVGDLEVPEEDQPEVARLLQQFNCYPVFVDAGEAKLYYEDYCKQTLWPAFHNVVDVYSPVDVVVDAENKSQDGPTPCWNPDLQKLAWHAYSNVNQLFANVRASHCGLISGATTLTRRGHGCLAENLRLVRARRHYMGAGLPSPADPVVHPAQGP